MIDRHRMQYLSAYVTAPQTVIATFSHKLGSNENYVQAGGLIQAVSELQCLLVSATFVLRTLQWSGNQQLFRNLLLSFCICPWIHSWCAVTWWLSFVSRGCKRCCFHGCLLCVTAPFVELSIFLSASEDLCWDKCQYTGHPCPAWVHVISSHGSWVGQKISNPAGGFRSHTC